MCGSVINFINGMSINYTYNAIGSVNIAGFS